MDFNDTIVAQSTPPGVSALGSVRLSGDGAIEICSAVFEGPDLLQAPGNTLHHGFIKSNGERLDEVVVGLFRGPKSYTGQDVVEISCHGSQYILERIISVLLSRSARLAEPGEFTLRAFLNGKMDLSQAEAVADLIASANASSHRAAITQLRGGFSNQIKKLRQELIQFASLVELELDFGEEDVEFAERKQLLNLIGNMGQQLGALIKSFELGNAIKNGVSTVIAGRPNAGKSTLLNALLNEERAIVSEIPGTTRDTVEEVLHIKGVPFRLIDTAGLRDAASKIEALGVERTKEAMRNSAVVLFLFDATHEEGAGSGLEDLQNDVRVIKVANKVDLLNGAMRVADDVIPISAKNRQNLDALEEALFKALVEDPRALEQPVVTSQRHVHALQRARAALETVNQSITEGKGGELLAIDLRVALDALGEITGEITSETLLQGIFERFCIGK